MPNTFVYTRARFSFRLLSLGPSRRFLAFAFSSLLALSDSAEQSVGSSAVPLDSPPISLTDRFGAAPGATLVAVLADLLPPE